MKFTVTQQNLSQGLNIVSHIASKNTTLPILNNVLIKAENGAINLSTTNLELGVSCTIRGKVDKDGVFTVQSKLISDFINLINTDKVEIDLEDEFLKIESEKSKTKIKGNVADEFPVIPEVESENIFKCKLKDLVKGLSQVLFATSNSETRPEISGVNMKFENGGLIMASTDSYRLAEKSIKCGGVEAKTVIIPGRSLSELVRILSNFQTDQDNEQDNSFVEISFKDNQVQFSYQNVKLVSRLIEGTYPDYQQIIPKEKKTTGIIDKNEFIKAVKTASLFSRLGVFDVIIEFKDGKIIVSSDNVQLGKSETEIEGVVDGENNSIVLNHKFLSDGLSNIDSTAIVFEMNDEASPCVLRPAETLEGAENIVKQDYLYIVMPIKQ